MSKVSNRSVHFSSYRTNFAFEVVDSKQKWWHFTSVSVNKLIFNLSKTQYVINVQNKALKDQFQKKQTNKQNKQKT